MSSPQSRAARQRSAMTNEQTKGLTVSENFLLTCSDATLDNFELAILDREAQLRAEMHELEEGQCNDASAAIREGRSCDEDHRPVGIGAIAFTKEVRRFGKGGPLDPYHYFASGDANPEETRKPKHISRIKQNSALLKTMRGEEGEE